MYNLEQGIFLHVIPARIIVSCLPSTDLPNTHSNCFFNFEHPNSQNEKQLLLKVPPMKNSTLWVIWWNRNLGAKVILCFASFHITNRNNENSTKIKLAKHNAKKWTSNENSNSEGNTTTTEELKSYSLLVDLKRDGRWLSSTIDDWLDFLPLETSRNFEL